MDPDYVMMNLIKNTSMQQWSVHERRTQAMRQWAVAKADQDFMNAEDCIASLASWQIQGWLAWQAIMAAIPMEIFVLEGECFTDWPLCISQTDENL